MTTEAWPHIAIGIMAMSLVILLALRERASAGVTNVSVGGAGTRGRREIQADAWTAASSRSGYMAAVADGMGKGTLSAVLARIACQTVEEQYAYHGDDMNTALFFKNTMSLAHRRVKTGAGGERCGVSLIVIVIVGDRLHYARCGNAELAVIRNGNFVSLCAGHTMREYAEKLFSEGKISREDAISHINDKRVYRYMGHEEFEPDGEETPVRLQPGDRVVLMTDGVIESLGRPEIARLLAGKGSGAALADELIQACKKSFCEDNATAVVVKV
jgi:serine/threonine protein phosphatase PrpC